MSSVGIWSDTVFTHLNIKGVILHFKRANEVYLDVLRGPDVAENKTYARPLRKNIHQTYQSSPWYQIPFDKSLNKF